MHKIRQEAEIRVRVKRNPREFFRKAALTLIFLYAGYIVFGFIHDMVVVRIARAEQVAEGVIQATVPARGILVRNEKVVTAPRSGKLKVMAPEGERVRVGQVVAQVIAPSLETKTGEKVFNVCAPSAGLVSYHLDGLEAVYSPENIKELDLAKIDTIKSEPRQIMPGGQVEAGKPVLKIVNNLAPLTVMTKVQANVLPKEETKTVFLVLGKNENELCRATILDDKFKGQSNQALLSIRDYDSRLITDRRLDFKIVSHRYEGFVVPVEAVVRKEGKPGIYTIYKEQVKWKKVEVVGGNQENTVISGITPEIKVILKPQYVKEGSPFR